MFSGFRWLTGAWLVVGLLVSSVSAEDWPVWRGPRGDGTSRETNVPVQWSATENIAWKTPLPVSGHSSPIVWKDTIFVVGVDVDPEASRNNKRQPDNKVDRVLLALDRRTGKILWQRVVVRTLLEQIHRLNSRASSTPATDGKLVYVSFLDDDSMYVAAFDFEGNEVWKVRPGVFSSRHGYCSSPIFYKDKLIVNGDHDGEAYLVALDRRTGKTLWKTDRENKTRSYCTPIIREIDGRTQMLLSGSKCVASFDPNNGKRHWIIDGPTEQFVASLVYSHGLVFVTGGFPDKHILTIDPRGSGNVTDSHIRWRHYRQGVSYVPSPIAVGKFFFVVSDEGLATCLDAVTGKKLWIERIGRHNSASLVSANGLIYFLDDDGVTKVVKATDTFEVVATNELEEAAYASPVISQGQILIRGEKHLFCIGEANKQVSR